jgi:release factor glutamine methyltransferase
MDVKQALGFATKILRLHTCEGSDAEREAGELLAFSIGTGRADLLSDQERGLSGEEESRLAEFLSRRIDHEPMAHIFGTASFLGRNFIIDRNVLIPRPATELIVRKAIEKCAILEDPTVIDVGTGCGCIAVSIALAVPDLRVTATDISPEALETAGRNALTHGAKRIRFLQGNLLKPISAELKDDKGPLVVIANLPYIPTEQIYYLSPCVTIGDPLVALDGGPDGLDLYRKLLEQIADLAARQEMVSYFELLPGQVSTMRQEIEKRFPGVEIEEIRPSEDGEVIGLEVRKS